MDSLNVHLRCLQQLALSNSPWKPPPLAGVLSDMWKIITSTPWDAFSVTHSQAQEASSPTGHVTSTLGNTSPFGHFAS